MAFKSNIPQPTEQLSISQPDLLGNFTAIGTMMAPDSGLISFPFQAVTPPTAATTVGLVGKMSVQVPARTALCFIPDTGAPVTTAIDFTTSFRSALPAVIPPPMPINGWCRLPSGILLKWGRGLSGGAGSLPSLYFVDPTFPVFVHVYTAQISPEPTGGGGDHYALYLEAYTTVDITVKHDSAIPRHYTYLVIGD